jgi:hypothetical protein
MDEKFMKALDLIQPDWFISNADETDLREAMRLCIDPHNWREPQIDGAKALLRHRVSQKLALGARAFNEIKA